MENPQPDFVPGGAFCDCGEIEFVVPSVPRVRQQYEGQPAIEHTPVRCFVVGVPEIKPILCPKCGNSTSFVMEHRDGSKRRFFVCIDKHCSGGVWVEPMEANHGQ